MRVQYFTRHTISVVTVFLLLLSLVPSQVAYASTVETRYMRGDQQTINGLLAYILGTSQSSSLQVASGMANGRLGVLWSSDVVVRHADGSETTIGTKIAQMSRSVNGEGIQSASWTCPLTSLVSTDAVVIKVYDKYGAGGAWNLRATFITEQLGASQLDNVAWIFYYYTYRLYDGSDTYGDFIWGTSTYNSRMENFTWTAAPSGAWHDVSTWTTSLIGRTWLNETNFNLNLSTRQYVTVGNWFLGFEISVWKSVSTWQTYLLGVRWNDVATWLLETSIEDYLMIAAILTIAFSMAFTLIVMDKRRKKA